MKVELKYRVGFDRDGRSVLYKGFEHQFIAYLKEDDIEVAKFTSADEANKFKYWLEAETNRKVEEPQLSIWQRFVALVGF